MCHGSHVPLNRLNRPDHPLQQVDDMDRLIHQYSAVEGLGSAPCAAVIVALGPPPRHVGHRQDDASQSPTLDEAVQGADTGLEASLAYHGELHPCAVLSLEHAVDVSSSECHWLLYDDMLASGHGLDRLLGVQSGRSADVDDVHILSLQHHGKVGTCRCTVFGTELFGRREGRRDVCDRDQLRLRKARDGSGMYLADDPAPGEPEADGAHSSLSNPTLAASGRACQAPTSSIHYNANLMDNPS